MVTVKGEEVRLTTLGGYFDALERGGIAPNVATYVGLGNVWESVMGESFDRPTPEQLDEMKAVLDEAMHDGAFGLSSMLMAPPATVATTDDLVELCGVVREHGGIYSSHIRNEGLDVVEAVNEAIAIGERAGVPVDIIHLKIADQKLWGRMNELVALIEQARSPGRERAGERLSLHARQQQPGEHHPPLGPRGGPRGDARPPQGPRGSAPRLKHDIHAGLPGWYNHYTAVGGDWSRMLDQRPALGEEPAVRGADDGPRPRRACRGQVRRPRPARRALRPAHRGRAARSARSTRTTPRRT